MRIGFIALGLVAIVSFALPAFEAEAQDATLAVKGKKPVCDCVTNPNCKGCGPVNRPSHLPEVDSKPSTKNSKAPTKSSTKVHPSTDNMK
jgi:hypothetical protein